MNAMMRFVMIALTLTLAACAATHSEKEDVLPRVLLESQMRMYVEMREVGRQLSAAREELAKDDGLLSRIRSVLVACTGDANKPGTFEWNRDCIPTVLEFVISSTDGDLDSDGVRDGGTIKDNCPMVVNPAQLDRDTDGIGDGCDECPDDSKDTCVQAESEQAQTVFCVGSSFDQETGECRDAQIVTGPLYEAETWAAHCFKDRDGDGFLERDEDCYKQASARRAATDKPVD